MAKSKSVVAKAKAWATKKKLFGTQAFLRYVILSFTECLNQVTEDFVFKGGNLLWVYIATPRATIDLDLATLHINSHAQIHTILEKACAQSSELHFKILEFKEVEQEGHSGAAVILAYSTPEGASNRFEMDIIYALSTDHHEIPSPIHEEIQIRSATIENIIADKVTACHRFKSGNTRMKDFDDLFRLSQSRVAIDRKKLLALLAAKNSKTRLDPSWINPQLERLWSAHRTRYKDLPEDLSTLFSEVNQWLLKISRDET